MSNRHSCILALVALIAFSGCGDDDSSSNLDASADSGRNDAGRDGSADASGPPDKVATAMIEATSLGGGSNMIAGTATFEQRGSTVTVRIVLSDCPEGQHGFHIHQNNSCENMGGTPAGAAGPHWAVGNPGAGGHGSHIGDIGNVTCNASGAADQTFTKTNWTIGANDADTDIQGHALIVHENMDSEQPGDAGMMSSGGRIGCGLIVVSGDGGV